MSASQLTNASASGEWLQHAADANAEKSGEHPAGPAPARRQRFIRLVKLTMAGLVAFTALGLASYVWRRHTMGESLAEAVPAPQLPPPVAPAAAAAPPAEVNEPTAASAPPVLKTEQARAPAAKAPVPRKAISKSSRSPFLSATKTPAKVATRPVR